MARKLNSFIYTTGTAMVKLLPAIALLIISVHASGQDKLDAERPGETKTPELVKGNHLQAEIGFRKEKLSENENLYQHPDAILRFGLFNAIELRMNVTSQTIRDDISKQTQNGFKPLEFGVKAKVLPEYKWSPSIAVLGMIGIPSTASADYYNRHLPIEFRTLFSNTITPKIKLQYNAGIKWEGDDRQEQWMYSISPVFEVSDKVNLFLEEYAFLTKTGAAHHYFDGGILYFLGKSCMVDLSAGAGLSRLSSDYFIGAGFSLRLPMK
jgi:hypothetical protein